MSTLDEKRRLFLDMQERPDEYSEGELQAMLDDPEMSSDIESFTLLRRSALHDGKEISDEAIAEEWQKFSDENEARAKQIHKQHTPTFRLKRYKVAAIVIGSLLLVGTVFAAVRFIKEREPMPIAESNGVEASVSHNAIEKDTIMEAKAVASADSIVKFDDTELETVITTMAEHYAVKTEFKSESARHIHLFFIWNKRNSLADVLEVLNGYDRISVTLSDQTLIVK